MKRPNGDIETDLITRQDVADAQKQFALEDRLKTPTDQEISTAYWQASKAHIMPLDNYQEIATDEYGVAALYYHIENAKSLEPISARQVLSDFKEHLAKQRAEALKQKALAEEAKRKAHLANFATGKRWCIAHKKELVIWPTANMPGHNLAWRVEAKRGQLVGFCNLCSEDVYFLDVASNISRLQSEGGLWWSGSTHDCTHGPLTSARSVRAPVVGLSYRPKWIHDQPPSEWLQSAPIF
ncbi:MAG: hypothetical protein V1857_06865 [archaeon]